MHSQHIHALISLRGLDSDGGSASYLPVAMVNRSIRAPLMMAVFILTFDRTNSDQLFRTENFSISEFVKAAF